MKNARTRRAQQDQGFTLFLVLIVLFLMMLLGITYLRVMRMSSTQSAGSTGNMAPVLTRLKQDIQAIVGADGNLNAYEPHDYPWTCTRANAPCQLTYPYRVTSGIGMGDPKVDDAWLSPIEAENGKWAQVTNLYGSFLNYADKYLDNIPVNVNTLARVPADAPAGRMIDGMANNQFVVFQDLDAADPRLVDADGDGVGDSLWFYPPESLQGDLRYIAAVRIIDASGLLNLNTALGELGQDPSTVGSGTPRKGEGTHEIDARPLLGGMSPASKTFRQGSIAAGPSGRAPADWSDWDYDWASGARTTDTGDNQSANRYGALTYEAKLRDHFNEHADDGSPEAQLWRDYPTLGNNAGNRKYVTTASGVREVCPSLPLKTSQAMGATTRPGDLSLSQTSEGRTLFNNGSVDVKFLSQQAGNTGHSVASLVAAGIQTADSSHLGSLHSDSFNGEYPYSWAFQRMCPSGSSISILLARQMNACWADALDRDNAVTVDGGHWMGWEPLPILTEFYAQMPYFVCGNVAGYNYAPTPSGPNYSVVYINTTQNRDGGVGMQYNQPAHEAGLGSYAFEVANPYDIPIRLTHVRFIFGTQSDASSFDALAGVPLSTSKPLDAYVNAAPPPGMAKDAEGHFVLKPGEKIVFYRNGTGGEPAPSSPSVGAKSDISGLIDTSDGKTYKVDLGTAISGDTAAPDINGHYGSRNLEHFSLQCLGQNTNGILGTAWYPYNRMSYNSMPTGSTAYPLRCLNAERNVPGGRQGAPGDLVYHQVDVRTFGVDQKLDLLQARPPVIKGNSATNDVIDDWGDMEYRSNLYANVGSGVYPTTLPGRYPPRDATANLWWHTNPIAAASMPLNPNWMAYDTTLPALGKSKISFPGPNGGHAMYATGRQSIQNEKLWFNYVGIPDDADYPGTFPELTVAGSPMDQRNNGTAAGGASRADGVPRVLDLLRAPFVGPRIGGSYRGSDGLIVHALRNTIGDAINYFLVQDTASLGVRNMRLRTDVPWFDTSSAAKVAQYAPALPYSPATNYAVNQEAWHDGEIYAAQQAGTLPEPGADSVGPAGSGKQWACSNGPFARASQCWQHSFAEVLLSRFQVDSQKYKGKTGANGDNWKPGVINLNTAPQAVLGCLSAPTGTLSAADTERIIANRKAPASGVSAAGGARKGLVLASEAFGPLAGLGDADFDTLSWLPQQATCRSDTFIAYIVVQGYRKDNFNLGPVEVARQILVMTRDGTGGVATLIGGAYAVPLK